MTDINVTDVLRIELMTHEEGQFPSCGAPSPTVPRAVCSLRHEHEGAHEGQVPALVTLERWGGPKPLDSGLLETVAPVLPQRRQHRPANDGPCDPQHEDGGEKADDDSQGEGQAKKGFIHGLTVAPADDLAALAATLGMPLLPWQRIYANAVLAAGDRG